MVVAILTILLGALGTAAGVQELVVQGILNNQTIPLIGGTLGAVAASLLVAAGIALLRQSDRAVVLTRAAALTVTAALVTNQRGSQTAVRRARFSTPPVGCRSECLSVGS